MNRSIIRLTIFLAVLVALAAALGPLGAKIISFHVSPDATSQYVGGEIATLLAVVALLTFVRKNHPANVAVLLGVLIYIIYTFVTVIMGQSYDAYTTQNAEYAFYLYALITASAVVLGGVLLPKVIDASVHHTPTKKTRAVVSVTFFVIASLFFALWTLQILSLYAGNVSPEYTADKPLFWLIKYLDLGFIIPTMVMIGVALRRGKKRAELIALTGLSFAVAMTLAIACMSIAQGVIMHANTWPVVGGMLVMTVAVSAIARRLYGEIK